MSRDLKIGMIISAEDRASNTVRRTSATAVREAERVGVRTTRAVEDATRAQERARSRTQTTEARAVRAREQLHVRSQQIIGRNYAHTEAAQRNAARTARAAASEQSRAYGQVQNRVSGLRKEMAGLEQQNQRTNRGMGAGSFALRAGAALGAGAVAGAMVLRAPVKRTMDYESRLLMMSNTAYSDRDSAGRISGARDLKEAVNNAVRQGGGSRDAAAEALDEMLASGAMSHASAVNLLPTLQRASTATGAASTDLAQVAISGMQTFGIKENQIPQMLDMAVKAGQEGGFELKDMASWLPKVMAMAKTAGMSGIDDFGSLAAALQASKITAGSADAGGNNLANLLAKINSRDTSRQAAKIEIAPGQSIDLAGTLSKAAGKGMNTLDAFVGIVDQVVARDKDFQALQKRLNDPSLQDSDRTEIMKKQADILQGSSVGKIIQDQQALLALVGVMGNRQYVKDIKGKFGNGVDAIGVGFDVMASSSAFKDEQGSNAWQSGEFEAFKGFAGVIGDTSGKLAELAAEYPEMTKWVVGSTEALKALAAAAGAAAVVGMVRGRRAAGTAAAASGAAAAGEVAAARGAATGGSALMRGFKRVGAAGPLIGAVGVYEAGQIMTDSSLAEAQKIKALNTTAASSVGGYAGMKAGAALGTVLWPGIGTLAGGVAGGIGGALLGDELAQYVQHLQAPTEAEMQARMRGGLNQATGGVKPEDLQAAMIAAQVAAKKEPQVIDLKVTVDVQNGNIVAAVNEVNDRESRRH